MFDDETIAFLESGCALIVGTVSDDGAPHAGRGWGLEVSEPGPPLRCRLLVDADDERTLDHIAAGSAMAVTATSVETLRSIQLKGRALAPEVAGSADVERAGRYVEELFHDVHAMDGVEWETFRRIVPSGYVACSFEAHESYDQTPGPGAGARVGATGGG